MIYNKLISTNQEYKLSKQRLNELWDKENDLDKAEENEVELLIHLIDHYEEKHFPVPYPDPINAIQNRMQDLGLSLVEGARTLGIDKGTLSKVLNRERGLSLKMIRMAEKKFSIPAYVLIQEAKIKSKKKIESIKRNKTPVAPPFKAVKRKQVKSSRVKHS